MPRLRASVPHALLLLALLVGPACPRDAPPEPQRVEPATPAEAEADPAPAKADPAPAEAKAPEDQIPVLTEEDLRLLATDPKDLSVEDRRKRAYARRRQILQNPDSPAARAIKDLAAAARAGELDVNGSKGVTFHAPGTKPTGGRPPAGWRPGDGKGSTEAKPAATADATPKPATADAAPKPATADAAPSPSAAEDAAPTP